ncbi:MAG: hypothetical protein ACKVQK_28330 [Burkholderiales bacterium]
MAAVLRQSHLDRIRKRPSQGLGHSISPPSYPMPNSKKRLRSGIAAIFRNGVEQIKKPIDQMTFMKKRDALITIAALVTMPVLARAQATSKLWRIGFLAQGSEGGGANAGGGTNIGHHADGSQYA